MQTDNLAPVVRLAHLDGTPASNCLAGQRGHERMTGPVAPALLISYHYIRGWVKHSERYFYRDWALDSGAFSAHNSNQVIDLQEYTEFAKERLATDPTLTEVFALDVIGDHAASLRNCEYAWEQGVPVIPTYHRGSPESALLELAAKYPKVALGGVARLRGKLKREWSGECFARIWPKPVHGLGFGAKEQVLGLPFHSTDASNWELGPSCFGNWKTYGKMSVRGSDQDLRVEVMHYLELERQAQHRWSKQMAEIDPLVDEYRQHVAAARRTA